jgi:hypothetical protein
LKKPEILEIKISINQIKNRKHHQQTRQDRMLSGIKENVDES